MAGITPVCPDSTACTAARPASSASRQSTGERQLMLLRFISPGFSLRALMPSSLMTSWARWAEMSPK